MDKTIKRETANLLTFSVNLEGQENGNMLTNFKGETEIIAGGDDLDRIVSILEQHKDELFFYNCLELLSKNPIIISNEEKDKTSESINNSEQINIPETLKYPKDDKVLLTGKRIGLTSTGYEVISEMFHSGGVPKKGNQVPFLVEKGSEAALKRTGSFYGDHPATRESLIKQGVLKINGGHYVFTRDFEFPNSWIAASVIQATSINGRDFWVNLETGESLKVIQDRRIF